MLAYICGMKSKQVIVMRKDLNMRKGKMVAQGAHASMKAILDQMDSSYLKNQSGIVDKILEIKPNTAMADWIKGSFAKICLSVDSEAELLEIYNKAKEAGLISALIIDAGLTEFNGVPTKTCCAIGPAWSQEIDKITGNLKLL